MVHEKAEQYMRCMSRTASESTCVCVACLSKHLKHELAAAATHTERVTTPQFECRVTTSVRAAGCMSGYFVLKTGNSGPSGAADFETRTSGIAHSHAM